MSGRIFITGIGITSAIGMDVASSLDSLIKMRHGMTLPTFLPTRHADFHVGEVKASNNELCTILEMKKNFPVSRTTLLGCVAGAEAIAMSGIKPETIRNELHFINGTSVSAMDISEKAFQKMIGGESVDYQRWFSRHDCGKTTDFISEYLGFKNLTTTISTACSSGANSIMQAGRNIKHGVYDLALAGGTDALSLFTLNGFNSLKILDKDWCKPFDIDRKGLNLGEGAAYLLLESEKSILKTGSKPLAELAGFGNANDAYHQTASSPEGIGATLAMQKAFETSAIKPGSIDYINAHGTGTENNDHSESIAIRNVFGDKTPAYSSTKAYTGHTLAAAGALEAVISVLAIRENLVFPNLNLDTPIDIIGAPVLKLENKAVNTVLSNSFGFGGNCTSLIFRTV